MFSRRRFLHLGAVLSGAVLLPVGGVRRGQAARAAGATAAPADSTVRVAHMTDWHLRPDRGAAEGIDRALQRMRELNPAPDLILDGGDVVHNARQADRAYIRRMYRRARALFDQADPPIRHCIGNHDCIGWGSDSPIKPGDPMYGKAVYQERLGVDSLNQAFDLAGWRICIIDNILPAAFEGERGYQGGFDDAAMDFLENALTQAGDRPKLLCTHIPIISATAWTYTDDVTGEHRPMPTSLVTRNSAAILELLNRHRVALVLTGHLHQRERIAYQHTTHIGQGAVSGKWWGGVNAGTAEGFGVLDLHADGNWEHRYQTYGWEARVG